ncbi:hypothetical protein [Rhizobium leguminosarum]|uniref:Uncharacterized protein n=1 Tax=Rhizobium leguminosarum TaxID=384 RepID=A0A7K3VTU2_RHILE|nr:hypothetical protein [Rhizobium leguminosarum]NEK19928.1 hypothetical protein [Rhizobium leguminosarum]
METYWQWLTNFAGPDAGKIILTAFLSALGALIVGLVAATITTWLGIWRDQKAEERKRLRTEKHAAALLCSTLDLFINECLDGAIDSGVLDANLHLTPRTPYPALAYQKEVDWTCIDDGLMYSAFRLLGEVDSGRRAVEWEALTSEPPVKTSLFEERIIRISEGGLRASMLLADVKKTYAISTQDRSNVDLVQVFATTIAKTDERRRSRKEAEARKRIAEALLQGTPVPEPQTDATRRVIEALLQQTKPQGQS